MLKGEDITRRKLAGTVCALCLAFSACQSTGVHYDGENIGRVDRVDVFYDLAEIPREHRQIGEGALQATSGMTPGNVRHRFLREARRRGAHAVVIEDRAVRSQWIGSAGSREIMGRFLRYESPQPVEAQIIEPDNDPDATRVEGELSALSDQEPGEEIKSKWRWWWNRDKPVKAEPEPSAEDVGELERIDPTGTAVFTGDVKKLKKLGLPEPNQRVLDD